MTENGPHAAPSTRRIIGYGAVFAVLALIGVALIELTNAVRIVTAELNTIVAASQGPTRDMTEVDMLELLFGGLGAAEMAVAFFTATSVIVIAYAIAFGIIHWNGNWLDKRGEDR